MSINESHAQALIKGKLRKLNDAFSAYKPVTGKKKSSHWLKHMLEIGDMLCGADNLLYHSELHHSRSNKLLKVTRYYLWLRSNDCNGSADFVWVEFNPRKCSNESGLLPVHITNHALMRMTADLVDMVEVIMKLLMAAMSLYHEKQWPNGKSLSLYTIDGMFGVVKDVDEYRGELIFIKTFIRADKFDLGSEHERFHSDLEEYQFDNRPELKDKA